MLPLGHVFKDRTNINGSCQNAENSEELQIDDEQQNIKKNYPEILISEMGKLIIASDVSIIVLLSTIIVRCSASALN